MIDTEIADTVHYKADQPPERASRRDAIARAVSAHSGSIHYVPFRDGYLETPVVRLDNAMLVYRADNGRLFAELVAAGASREQEEDPAQQQLLHDLLIDKARDPSGPIFGELQQHAKQTEPLLIAGDGIVVNGNRRLASMRELRARDAERYAAFEEISVAVLPDTLSNEDLEYIETALQLAPDLKLDYSWTNRRLKLRDHVERLSMTEEEILAAYRFESSEAINRELAELELAEHYLRYAGSPGDYRLVEMLEEPFAAMRCQLDTFNNRKVVDLWTYAGFALIHARDALERPIEQYFPFARPVPFGLVHWVLRSLAEKEGLVEPQASGENRPVDAALADLLSPLLRDPDQAERLAKRICSLSDYLRANADQEIGGAQAVAHLQQAVSSLQHVDPESLTAAQAREIHGHLLVLNDYAASLTHGERTVGEKDRERQGGVLNRIFGRD